jgi:hypothetical protein
VSKLSDKSLNVAARAVWPIISGAVTGREPPPFRTICDIDREWAEKVARSAITAYLSAERKAGRTMMRSGRE